MFAASRAKLNRVVRVTKAAMEDIGLECNEKERRSHQEGGRGARHNVI